MVSKLLHTIMAALEEAEINSPQRPWELTMLPMKHELPLSRAVRDLDSIDVLTVHRNAYGIEWVELEYRGSEVLRVLREPTLCKMLEQRLSALPKLATVSSACELAEKILAEGVG